nr:MAG TPA: baseplate wedge protein [Caudoviricetes sp.]
MALSGAFTGTTGNQYIFPTIKWSAVQSIDGNYSDVTATLYYSRSNSGYTTSGTWSGGITIDGQWTAGSRYIEVSYQSGTLAMSATVRVYHDADGSRNVTISATGYISGTSLTSTDISQTVTLDTIPRATTAVVGNLTMGESGTITLTPASSSFTHTIRYYFGEASGVIATKTSSKSVSWTPPKSLAEQIPRATVGIGAIHCTTYNGNTEIGTISTSVKITVSDDMIPTISAVTIAETVAGLADKFGAYVQSKSRAKVDVTASGIYGSSIASCEVRVAGILYTGTSITSNMITASGDVPVQVKVTDTRGRSASSAKTITVLPYRPPKISELSAKRIDTTGSDNDDGTRVALTMAYAIASLDGKNNRTITLSYRKETETEFAQISTGTAEISYNDTLRLTDAPEISADDAYVIRVVLQDYFTSITSDVRVESTFSLLDFYKDGTGVAAGKAATQPNLFEFGMPASFPQITVNGKTLLDWTHPVGSIYQSTKSTDPADLFGGTWEAINNVFLLAAGTIYRPGTIGGESEVTLTVDEIPDHTHSYQYTGQSTVIGTDAIRLYDGDGKINQYTGQQSSNCGGKAHNNMPPYLAVYTWKRTA